jgi:glycerol-3-phosphate dehydrogenase (NAD(P)+)
MGERTVGILGGGAFGLALMSAAVRANSKVVLYTRRAGRVDIEGVRATSSLAEVARCELLILAVPAVHADALLSELAAQVDGSHLMVHVSRGLVDDRLNPMSHLIRRRTPIRRSGALAGPLTVGALGAGEPIAAIVGSDFPEVVRGLRDTLGSGRLRLYGTSDMLGVELASSLTGMLLFTLGLAKGLELSAATQGVLATRGLAEITRVGEALGGRPETFTGLAGVGDLMAALAGEPRPEMGAGLAVAAGVDPREALARSAVHVESDVVALRVAKLADSLRVATPIASTVAELLGGKLQPSEAIELLMSRDIGEA